MLMNRLNPGLPLHKPEQTYQTWNDYVSILYRRQTAVASSILPFASEVLVPTNEQMEASV
jgi:hypothetical protein